MSTSNIYALELGADALLFELARQAGVDEDDRVVHVEEIFLENTSSDGTVAVEVWTAFQAEGLDGQNYFAHLPGDLDRLIVRTVRDHAFLLDGE